MDPGGLADTPEAIARLLDAIDIWRADGLLDASSFARLRTHYERRRAELLPPPADEPLATPSPSEPALDDVERPESPPPLVPPDPQPPPAQPRRPPVLVVGEWAARRQADVLLYLGAFLLVVSALIFTSSRDQALSGGWRVAILAVYTAAFIAAGLLLRRWPRVREAGPAFLAIGALMTPLNFVLLYNEVLGDREVSGAVVWFAGSSYSTVFYAYLFNRGLGRLYVIPAAIALLSAWGSLAIAVGLPFEWFGAWWMGFALAATLVFSITRRWSVATVVPIAAIAILALLFANFVAFVPVVGFEGEPDHRWQLPSSYALFAVLASVLGWYVRQPLTLLAVTVLAIVTAFAGLWAAEVSPQWFSAPPLVASALLLVSRPRWQGWSSRLAHSAWLLTAAGVLAPFALNDTHLQGGSWGAAAAFLAAGALSAAVAWRNDSDGIFASDWDLRSTTHPLERVAFGWLGFGSLLIAVGFAQEALELDSPHTGWAFAALAAVGSVSLVVVARRRPALLWAILPALLLATSVSIQYPVDRFAGHDAVLLALPAAHVLAAFVLLRRWSLAAVSVALGMLALAALWEWQAWPWWRLAALYAAIAIPLFGVLTPLRQYRVPHPAGAETLSAVQALSWLPLAAAVAAALVALASRVAGASIEAVSTVEYRTLVLAALLLAPLLTFEAWRFRRWEPGVAALLVLLGSVAALWPVFDWPTWTLAVTYAVAGAGGFVALSRWRRGANDSNAIAVQVLSWLPVVAGILAARIALGARLEEAAIEAPGTTEYRALVLIVLLLAPLLTFEAWRLRRWEPLVAVLAVVFGCAAALWPVFDWPAWILAGAYSLAGAGAFLALSRWRRIGTDTPTLAVQALSWAGLVLGPLMALQAMDLRLETLDANPATLVEFRMLAALLLPLAAAVEFEGRRLGIRWASLPASALVMVALELAIATLEPGNVQAHTVPAALYLALVGLTMRTSETLSRNLSWHEVLQLAGAALLVLPQAEQGFEPGGARWGLVLLIEGIALLGIAMALSARWLGVSAVVTLSGVALRFLWLNRETQAVPYWLMLAAAGFLLLAIGLTVLLQREWWDRNRARVQGWWRRDAVLDAHSPLAVPVPILFTALAPALVILAIANLD